MLGVSGFQVGAFSPPSTCLLATLPAIVVPVGASPDGQAPEDPIVPNLVASIGERYGFSEAIQLRTASAAKIAAVLGREETAGSDHVLMMRLLAVLGVDADTHSRAQEALSVVQDSPRAVAAWESPTASSAGVLWIVDERLELSDLIEICREAARGCRQSMAARASGDPVRAASSESADAGIGPQDAGDRAMADRDLAVWIAREAEARYFADEVLRKHADELARRGFVPPMSRDPWTTPGRTAWQVAHDRFADSPGRDYLVRVLDRHGSVGEAGSEWFDGVPQSTAELLHGHAAGNRTAPTGDPARSVADDDEPDLPLHPVKGSLEPTSFVLGELRTELVLRLAADPLRALGAAVGWRDDRIAWTDDLDGEDDPVGEVVTAPAAGSPEVPHPDSGAPGMVLWNARMDSEEDARELVDALRKLLERRYVTRQDPKAEITRDSRDLAWCRARVGGMDWAVAGRQGAVVRFAISVERPLPEWARSWAVGPLDGD